MLYEEAIENFIKLYSSSSHLKNEDLKLFFNGKIENRMSIEPFLQESTPIWLTEFANLYGRTYTGDFFRLKSMVTHADELTAFIFEKMYKSFALLYKNYQKNNINNKYFYLFFTEVSYETSNFGGYFNKSFNASFMQRSLYQFYHSTTPENILKSSALLESLLPFLQRYDMYTYQELRSLIVILARLWVLLGATNNTETHIALEIEKVLKAEISPKELNSKNMHCF